MADIGFRRALRAKAKYLWASKPSWSGARADEMDNGIGTGMKHCCTDIYKLLDDESVDAVEEAKFLVRHWRRGASERGNNIYRNGIKAGRMKCAAEVEELLNATPRY